MQFIKIFKINKNYQVTDSAIKKKAQSISGSNHQKVEKIFHFVQYGVSYERYSNSKYGAVKTLLLKKGNCCDQAHLLVALFRAAGILARYVHRIGHCRLNQMLMVNGMIVILLIKDINLVKELEIKEIINLLIILNQIIKILFYFIFSYLIKSYKNFSSFNIFF